MEFNDGLYNLYREVDELSLLNKLFATLLSERLNIDNYLANVKIENKTAIKDTLENINYLLSDALENIKNLIKIKRGYPIYKLDDIELISIIKTKVSGEYKESVVIENINSEMNIIINLIKEIISKIDTMKNYETINVLANISFQMKTALLGI